MGASGRPSVQVLRPDDPAWDEWLDPVPRDIYHTAGYHQYARGSMEGEPYLIVVGDRDRGMAWPYLVRPVSQVPGLEGSAATDVNSVYGYPGPLAWGCEAGDAFLASAARDIVEIWRQQGAVAAFTRFHPLLHNAALVSGIKIPDENGEDSGGVVDGGKTVSVDLTAGLDAARADYGRDVAREARAMRRLGLTTIHDEEWRELPAFARLYRETMVRTGAHAYYFFSEDDFRRLRDALEGRLHLLVTRLGDTVAAAGLFTEFQGTVEWYLVGTEESFRHLSPAKLLVDDAIDWAIHRGASVLHLGGGRGGREDTLLWFKSRFSRRRHVFHTGRWTLDTKAYADLAAAREAAADPGSALDLKYFPVYRAPVVSTDGRRTRGAERVISMQVSRVGPESAATLGELLPLIDQTYFQPHPMTAKEAARIANLRGRDVYLIGSVDGTPVAYGMLRGWDEGFDIPSLGIGVRRDFERRGYGRAMMLALHDLARAGGAKRVRLRVHPDNVGASNLYRAVGYQEVGVERTELLMIVDL